MTLTAITTPTQADVPDELVAQARAILDFADELAAMTDLSDEAAELIDDLCGPGGRRALPHKVKRLRERLANMRG